MGFLGKFFGSKKSIISEVADVVDRFSFTNEEKQAAFERLYNKEIEDRNNARVMYGQDSGMQKVYAICFLLGYLCMIGVLLYLTFFHSTADLLEFEKTLITTLFVGMSTKVNTITDFFFGGSQKKTKVPNFLHKQGKDK